MSKIFSKQPLIQVDKDEKEEGEKGPYFSTLGEAVKLYVLPIVDIYPVITGRKMELRRSLAYDVLLNEIKRALFKLKPL